MVRLPFRRDGGETYFEEDVGSRGCISRIGEMRFRGISKFEANAT